MDELADFLRGEKCRGTFVRWAVVLLVAAIEQSLSNFFSREVCADPFGFQFGIAVRVRFNDRANVDCQLWVGLFAMLLFCNCYFSRQRAVQN